MALTTLIRGTFLLSKPENGYLESVDRGRWRITEKGREVVKFAKQEASE